MRVTYYNFICCFLFIYSLPEAHGSPISTQYGHKNKSKLTVIPYYLTIDYGSEKYTEISFPTIWQYKEDPPTSYSIPSLETQCGGIAYLLLKGTCKKLRHLYQV
jgi:hypothetical protein